MTNHLDQKITSLKERLRELEAEKKQKERAEKQADRQRARKAEVRRKYELGGLLKIAGLFECDKGALLGALLSIAPVLEDQKRFSEFKRVGDEHLARREQERHEQKQQPVDESYLQ